MGLGTVPQKKRLDLGLEYIVYLDVNSGNKYEIRYCGKCLNMMPKIVVVAALA